MQAAAPKITIAAGLAGIFLWSALLVTAARHIGSSDSGIGDMTLETADMPDPVPAPFAMTQEAQELAGAAKTQPAEITASRTLQSVRPVQPDVFAYPVKPATDALERIEARPFQVTRDMTIAQVKTLPVPRPLTVEAGLIAVGQGTLQLEGVKPTARTRQCDSSSGKPWPCGIIARTHQRMFLRNRTLDCTLDTLTWQGMRTAGCTLVGKSVGEWLVENGWAEAEAGSPLADKGRQAMEAKLGLFGDDPR